MKVQSIRNPLSLAPQTTGRAVREDIARRLLERSLAQLQHGSLIIEEGGVCRCYGESPSTAELRACIVIHNPAVYQCIAFGGTIGAGEAYMAGHWSSPNLTDVTRLFVRNMAALQSMQQNRRWHRRLLLRVFKWLHRNTLSGSRSNIAAHYDLGNDFFQLFLDREHMMYSANIYPHAGADLEQAASHRLQRIGEKLQLNSDDHLLEIGTGWGGMAIYAARHFGCRVTTTTISREQYEYARARVAQAGLEGQVTVLCQDYRELQGQYDKLVSIEMIEAVGYEHYDTYFNKCTELLKPEGRMLLQAITIADQRYEQARRSVDFIQRYIFPGGGLPSMEVIAKSVARQTDMVMVHLEDIGNHYARTLADWRQRFFARLDTVKSQGFDERFIRMWDYYLCYCEGGFRERSIGTVQVLLSKPLDRDAVPVA